MPTERASVRAQSRRRFLWTLTGGACASLTTARAHAVRCAAGPQPAAPAARTGVKIVDVRTYVVPQAILVQVVTDAGVSGWGETATDNQEVMRAFVHHGLKQHVIGQDPFDTERLWDFMFFENHDSGPSGALPNAIAGIDCAIWDLKGKLLGVPVYKLLGGTYRDRIRAYGSFAVRRGERTKEWAVRQAAKFVERGFTAVKLRMQIREHFLNIEPDPTFEYANAVRKVIGDKVQFYVDANNGYTAARAIEVGKRLKQECNILYFEDPISDQNHREMAQVVANLDVPIIAGEKEYTRWQLRELMIDGNVDVINPDCIKAGGLTEMKKIAAIAQSLHKPIIPHNTRPTLGTAATMHFAASISNLGPFIEYVDVDDFTDLMAMARSSVVYKEGYLHLPQGPGLGVEVDEAAVRRAAQG